LYELTLDGLIAVAEEYKVWGYRRLGPGGVPKLWRLQAIDHLNGYQYVSEPHLALERVLMRDVFSIYDPGTDASKVLWTWTLNKPDSQVSLQWLRYRVFRLILQSRSPPKIRVNSYPLMIPGRFGDSSPYHSISDRTCECSASVRLSLREEDIDERVARVKRS